MSVKIATSGHPERTRRFTLIELKQATGNDPVGSDADASEPEPAAK